MDRVGRASDGIATNEALLEQLDDALVAYYEALDRGETIDEGAFESTYPQCAAELRAFLARERRLHAQCRDLAHGTTVGRAPPRRLGRFELEQPLGVGGHGAVWRARDVELNRRVALKLPRLESLGQEERDRLMREARIVAQLEHAHIVRMFDVGAYDGQPYLVSELVEGGSLADQLRDGVAFTARDSVILAAKVADALVHAHDRGVVHRDIKPSNVLIDALGEPRLSDFGLARHDASEATMTLSGQVLGTPAYMSPEQARGDSHTADCRTDVYSLGVLLFELLTGDRPFRGNFNAIWHQLMHAEPPRIRQYNPKLSSDLETIVRKCMEKEPARRYQTARDVRDELQRFLDGKPIVARPVGPAGRAYRWARRNPAVAGLSGAVLASLIVALAVAVTSNARIRRESAATAAALRDRTAALGEKESALAERETALTAARENALKERRRYYTAQINLASQAWKDGQPARTSQLLETLRPRRGEIDLRGFEWRHLYHVCNANVVNRWRGHASAILDSAWSPQGDEFATASSDGYVRFWDGASGELRGEMATNEEMWYGYVDVAFDGSGALLATLRSNGEVRIWDVARRQPLHRWTARGVGHGGLAISPRGDTVAVGGVHSQSKAPAINLWTLAGERTQSLLGLVGEAAAVAFSPDGQYLAAAVRDDEAERNLVVWRLTPQPEIVGELADVGAGGLEFSHDGASLWASCDPAASDGASLHEIETAGWTLARSLHGHSENVLGLGVDAAGRSVATASADRSVRRWDPASGESQLLGVELAHIQSACVSPDGHRIATTDNAGWITLRDTTLPPAVPSRAIRGSDSTAATEATPVHALAFAPDGRQLVIGGEELVQIDVDDLQVHSRAYAGPVLAILPDQGLHAAYVAETGRMALYGPGGDAPLRWLDVGRIDHAAYSPDGRYLATWEARDNAPVLKVWQTSDGSLAAGIPTAYVCFLSAAFAPDSRRLATGLRFERIEIYDMEEGYVAEHALAPKRVGVSQCAYSPDGALVVAGCEDGRLGIYDVDASTGAIAAPPRHLVDGHTQLVSSLAFSPQEPLLVSAGRDGSVRLWDAIGGQERVTLNTDAKLVAFAPDGGCIALADEAGQISLLRASTLEDALAGQRWRAFEDRDCPFTVIRNAMDELRRENLELAKELFLQAEEGIVGDVVGSMWTPELVDAYLLFARVGVSPHGKSPAEMIVHARELAAERLERHPAEDSAYLARARVYAAEGDWPAAVDCMRRTFALPYGSQAVRAWSPVTLRYLRDGEIDRYQQCCRLMAQRIASFDDPKAWYSLGWTCCQGPDALEDWTPLLDFGRRAVAEAPGSREYAVMLGGVLLRSGAHDEAADFLAKLIDRFEAQHQILTFKVHAHFLCAMAEWRAGRQDEARRRLAAARELAQQPWQGAPLSHPKSPLLLESEAVALIK